MAFGKLLGANKNSAGSFPDYMLGIAKGNGLVKDTPEGLLIPRRQELVPQVKTPGTKTVKIRYGPYKVPGTGSKDHHAGMPRGMLENYPDFGFEKPCSGDCTIIGMRPGLEFPNGTVANIDSGPWLHHSVLVAIGPGRSDITCSQYDISIPHMGVNSTPNASERFFAIGNERIPLVFPDLGHDDVGYRLGQQDRIAAIIDLANENVSDEVVYFTMIWDYLEGHTLKHNARMVWHDIRNCGSSEANTPKGKSELSSHKCLISVNMTVLISISAKFDLQGTWKSTVDGEIVAILNHMHDGGTRTLLLQDGSLACESKTSYGSKQGYITGINQTHISDLSICTGESLKLKEIKKGQEWIIKAEYDFDQHKGLKGENNDFDKVMGINYMYIKG